MRAAPRRAAPLNRFIRSAFADHRERRLGYK
jgi:hypothetical protein